MPWPVGRITGLVRQSRGLRTVAARGIPIPARLSPSLTVWSPIVIVNDAETLVSHHSYINGACLTLGG